MDFVLDNCSGLTKLNNSDFLDSDFPDYPINIKYLIANNKAVAYRIGEASPFINNGKILFYYPEGKELSIYNVLFIRRDVFRILGKIRAEDMLDDLPEELGDWLIFNIDLFNR
jgi:hypothetical protein